MLALAIEGARANALASRYCMASRCLTFSKTQAARDNVGTSRARQSAQAEHCGANEMQAQSRRTSGNELATCRHCSQQITHGLLVGPVSTSSFLVHKGIVGKACK